MNDRGWGWVAARSRGGSWGVRLLMLVSVLAAALAGCLPEDGEPVPGGGGPSASGAVDVYRWWSAEGGDHFYTTDPEGEIAPTSAYGYEPEGVVFAVWLTPDDGRVPLYRWFSGSRVDHFYTTAATGELAPSGDYSAEGILGYVYPEPVPGTVPLHRWWQTSILDHFYTIDPDGEVAPMLDYGYEGIEGYVLPRASTPTPPPTEVDCSVADVLFLVDTTGSMAGEIDEIQRNLTGAIIPGLSSEVDDLRFAVARFDDFPVAGYGDAGDAPFESVTASTGDVTATQNAVNGLTAAGGGDLPESQVEALYQAATGAGLSPWIPSADCPSGTGGYACFRAGAQPIVLLFTDAPFHNGPDGSEPYSSVEGAHSYAQAVSALNGIGAKVLGLWSGSDARADLERVARDTGALDPSGAPIVFDIGTDGGRLAADVVEAVRTLCR